MTRKEGPAAPTAFQSLVERSITAWNSLNYVGVDQANVTRKNTERLKSLSSLETLLEDAQFWFFQLKESFIQQQLLMKWHPLRLEEYILLPIDNEFVNCQDCFFVSHYWHTREHPDPEGHDMCLFREDLVRRMVLRLGGLDMHAAGSAERRAEHLLQENAPLHSHACAGLRLCMEVPRLRPRAWTVAEYTLNHTEYIITADMQIFVSHVEEMFQEGVRRFQTRIHLHKRRCRSLLGG
jgi:hypothetical protein